MARLTDGSPNSENIPIVIRMKFSASVHVLGVVSSEGDVMPLHFFKKEEIVTKEVYLRVLMDVVKPWMETGVRKTICFSAGRCIGSYESFDSKLALRQRRYVLVQGILASQQPRFKSLGLLHMERS